jgi:hypothetical protein
MRLDTARARRLVTGLGLSLLTEVKPTSDIRTPPWQPFEGSKAVSVSLHIGRFSQRFVFHTMSPIIYAEGAIELEADSRAD